MTEQRLPCKTPGCANTIQPATARRTGGYCGPCAGKIANAARVEYIRKHRKDVDLYAGLTDPVDILRIVHQPRTHDPLVNLLPPPQSIEELYASLSPHHTTLLMNAAATELSQNNTNFAESVAGCLAAFTRFSLDPLLSTFLDKNHFWPSFAFRDARSSITSRLIRALDSEEVNHNLALRALAWIRDPDAVAFVQAAAADPTHRVKNMKASVDAYTLDAAWEIEAGHQRDLFLSTSLAFTPAPDGITDPALKLCEELPRPCSWCRRPLVALLEIDVSDDRFAFLRFPGPRLQLITCDLCACFGKHVFAELDDSGYASWSHKNERPRWLPTDPADWQRSPWAGVPLRLKRRSIFHAVDWLLPTTISQVGGLPAWVQSPSFPGCPRCARTMIFLAQVDNAQFRTSEGIFYAFFCRECRTTATTYQQS
ncbi:MAG TPA: hypothetical protein VF669_09355 [Tepidisphaeraceae bacterium]|jgi:hypothetical protein